MPVDQSSVSRRSSVTVLMYHYVRPLAGSRYPSINGLEVTDFKGQLDYIQRHYTVIGTKDMAAAMEGRGTLPKRAAILTFDDGYKDHFDYVLPALTRRRLTGVFFPPGGAILERKVLEVNKIHFLLASVSDHGLVVESLEAEVRHLLGDAAEACIGALREKFWRPNRFDPAAVNYIKRTLQLGLDNDIRRKVLAGLFTKYVSNDETSFAEDLYLSLEHLKEMAEAGMEIGSHGYVHDWLDSLPLSEQRDDISRSLEILDALEISRDGFLFCYPYGGYNQNTLTVLDGLGCAAAFTTQVDLALPDTTNRLQLPRLDTNDLPKSGGADLSEWTLKAHRKNTAP